MKVNRKIIFETVVGSHLYGTDRPESDMDYCGIFLPSTDDMLGLQNCPTEWSQDVKISTGDRNSAGDIDRKYYSLQRFLNLAAEGQSLQLEMLFAPRNRNNYVSPQYPQHGPGRLNIWQYPTRPCKDEWSKLLHNREMFLSKQSIMPFIGFAKAQAHKAVIKGENLNLIREMIMYLETNAHPHHTLDIALNGVQAIGYRTSQRETKLYNLNYVTTDGGTQALEIAGRQYEFTQQVRYVLQKLRRIEKQYGTRSEAAASNVYDYKSLMHAYRLIEEAKMILTRGEIVLPLDDDFCKFLKTVRAGEYQTDFFQELEDKLTELREVKAKSPLQETVNRGKIQELCQEMLYEHLFKGTTNG